MEQETQLGMEPDNRDMFVANGSVDSIPDAAGVEIGLNAAIVSVNADEPLILTVRSASGTHGQGQQDGLPFGPFSPRRHRTLDVGLRSWVREQTGLNLGYVEQLYTFGDRGRHARPGDAGAHVVSIGYLALTRSGDNEDLAGGGWQGWYDYFPWEDWRKGAPDILNEELVPQLRRWVEASAPQGTPVSPLRRAERARICFGLDGASWDEEKVLERYELLFEAGLVAEAKRDDRDMPSAWNDLPSFGQAMGFDHRRILATAMSRLRAKIKYRPVIFELMAEEFTLFELQKTVEAILGPHLHKQNFRRLVESAGLVEPTGDVRMHTGGRPAKLFRFRREVLLERPAPGVRVKPGRVA